MKIEDINIWRMRLTPGHPNPVNQFGFCYQRGIIGIGWSVDEQPDDIDHYLQLVTAKYEEAQGEGWKKAPKAISQNRSRNMNEGDLVWTRNPDGGRRYLGEITGPWEYRDGDEYLRADIVSVRRCPLHEVRVDDIGKDAKDFFTIIDPHLDLPPTAQRIVTDVDLRKRTREIWKTIQKQV